MNGVRWCAWQTKCVEDKKPGEWTCTAHLDEGQVFRCPKKDIADAKKFPGRCEDVESLVECPAGCLEPGQERRVRG